MPTSIRLIAGLGNPGRQHEKDRHNVGFWFASRLAQSERAELRSLARFHGLVARLNEPGGELWLVMPQTYMNVSGKCVAAIARFYKIEPRECLVVHDELDFPPGIARLKLGGGVAGHNGLKDIAERLGTHDFWRLRIGIGHPGDKDLVAGYVLSRPSAEDRRLIEASVDKGVAVFAHIRAGNMQAAMLKLHTPDNGAACP